MKRFRFFFIVLFLTGCTAVHEWNYTPLPAQTGKTEYKAVLIHPDLRDVRPAYQMPVEGTAAGAKLRPVSQLAQGAAAELENTGIFRAVNHTDNTDFNTLPQGSFLFLQGDLKQAGLKVSDGRASWGILGLPFWLVGIPYGKTENVLEIHYRLLDGTSRVLFEKTYTARHDKYNGYYYNPVEAEFEPLLRQISLELAADLKDCCAKQPKICN